MQVNLNEPLLLCQDSYLGNIYLGSEAYDSRRSVAFALATGFPPAGAAPPGIGKRLEATSARPRTTAPTPAHLVQKTAVGQRHGPRPPRTQIPVRAQHRRPD